MPVVKVWVVLQAAVEFTAASVGSGNPNEGRLRLSGKLFQTHLTQSNYTQSWPTMPDEVDVSKVSKRQPFNA